MTEFSRKSICQKNSIISLIFLPTNMKDFNVKDQKIFTNRLITSRDEYEIFKYSINDHPRGQFNVS